MLMHLHPFVRRVGASYNYFEKFVLMMQLYLLVRRVGASYIYFDTFVDARYSQHYLGREGFKGEGMERWVGAQQTVARLVICPRQKAV